jgi:hypothetical protein
MLAIHPAGTPMSEPRWLYWSHAIGLTLLALIHLPPVGGVAGGEALQRLYGVAADDASLQLLLRHRAMLFAIVAGIAFAGAWLPRLRTLALLTVWISLLSFLLLAWQSAPISVELARVQLIDIGALMLLVPLTVLALAQRLGAWRSS